MCRKVELFVIYSALLGKHVNIWAFIIHHLLEATKTTHENDVIGVGGTITVNTQALGHSGKFSTIKPHFLVDH